LKRPEPLTVQRHLHATVEARTELTLRAYEAVGHTLPAVIPILGYSARANHDAYFGDALGQDYRVMVEARASGIPLVDDVKARITGVPIGAAQNLFALFPLGQPASVSRFAIHQQLLDVVEAFWQAGYLLLDLQPQNIFYQPASGRLTVIDCSTLVERQTMPPQGRPRQDLHDVYLEILKFYTTPQSPPAQVKGYREPQGFRSLGSFERELDQMARRFQSLSDASAPAAALRLIGQVRQRAYTTYDDFRRDLMTYLEAAYQAQQALPNLPETRQVWREALNWLRLPHWQRYLFDAETELAGFASS
jgi:hypothetical protein